MKSKIINFYKIIYGFIMSVGGFRIHLKNNYSYSNYIELQKEKTTNPEKINKWENEEWNIKLNGFRALFENLNEFLYDKKNAICLGSRTGQEVVAMLEVVESSIGVDLVPFKPYSVEGDIHNLKYKNDEFDVVFTNIFDHSIYPEIFCSEMQRICSTGGVIIIHLQLRKFGDDYAENIVFSSKAVLRMFDSVEVVISRRIKNSFDGMNWELVLKKVNKTSQLSKLQSDNKQILWIDVGTHFAQEYESVFGSDFKFAWKLVKRLAASKILRRGVFLDLVDLKKILNNRKFFKANKDRFQVYFIEANSNIVNLKNIYLQADGVFNFAITSDKPDSISVTKLYLANDDLLSQGSSIFLEKDNVTKNTYKTTLGVSASTFFNALKKYMKSDLNNFKIFLRLNCEGVEDEVIYAAYNEFGDKLGAIGGSLKDVNEVKGDKAYRILLKFINDKKIPFINFSSSMNTWASAHNEIKKLLD
jgi:SAM-dependent methyltransferase